MTAPAVLKAVEGGERSSAGRAAAWWSAAAAYGGAIFLASSWPEPLGIEHLPLFADKAIHAAVYGGLSFVLWKALRSSLRGASGRRVALLTLGLTTLYGMSDEFHQSFVPGRSADVFDVAADAVGAGLVQWLLVIRRRDVTAILRVAGP